ncbi:MAG: FAD-dependent blue-light sensor [Rhodobacteraceae bacterium HLUCCA09]|nr:MAG: FAD-dependent blue-light sensor [Rhodobacteraceae bacterium HLUCCA09]
MPLFRLAYCSTACDLAPEDLEAILAACERNNAQDHVTGMLLFDGDGFLQLLEGSREATTSLFLRIAQDPRHRGVELLAAGQTDRRLFAGWSMHYVPSRGENASILHRYASDSRFSPADMTMGALEGILVDFAQAATETSPFRQRAQTTRSA